MIANQIKRFVLFGFNFDSSLKWMEQVNWTCNSDHMKNKFRQAMDIAGTYGVMPYFFSNLDSKNQEALLEYIDANFEG